MELAVLDSAFKREKLVENWSSLVWTERYSSNGEFELTSGNISQIMSLLPLGGPFDPPCLVAIGESDVPMVVENHKIEKKKNGSPVITTTGRSFETVLDQRAAIQAVTSGVPRASWQVDAQTAAIAAFLVAQAIIETGVATSKDIIPEIKLLQGVSDVGVTQKFPVEPKQLYDWMIDTLALGKYGLKSVLNTVYPGQIIVQTYKGTDRRTSVVFDVALGQVLDAQYLLSKLGYKNVMITATAHGMEFSTTGTDPEGLARRVAFLDLAGEITLAAGPELTNLTINKGKVALADRLPTALFSGGVASDVGAGYGSKYFLGDIVKLQGEYGLSQDARVAEFVRTQDQTGIKSYPTFEAYTA